MPAPKRRRWFSLSLRTLLIVVTVISVGFGCQRSEETVEPLTAVQNMNTTFNKTIILATDVASFFLFHPEDLKHRSSSPHGWSCCGFACGKEMESGRLVTFATGSDGGLKFRLTDGPLTEREKKWHAGEWSFRLRVLHGKVLLDNGNCLPNDIYCDKVDDDDESWIELPCGDYRATVHAIDWSNEPGAVDEYGRGVPDSLPSYVLVFSRVKDIRVVPLAAKVAPRLQPGVWGELWDQSDGESFQEQELREQTYVVHETQDWMIVPGFAENLPVSDELYEAVYGTRGSEFLPDRIEELAFCRPSACVGDFAVVAQACGASRKNNDPWFVSFRGMRLVQIAERINGNPWHKVRVKSVERGSSGVTDEQLAQLKSTFVSYGERNTRYRENIRNPDFEIERVQSLTKPESILHCLLHHVQITAAEKARLIFASDQERARGLLEIMKRDSG